MSHATSRFTLAELAERLGVTFRGDPQYVIVGLSTLQSAQAHQLSFLANPRYQKQLANSSAGAVIVHPKQADLWSGAALISPNPYLTFAQASVLFRRTPSVVAGIDATAIIAADAQIDPSAQISARVVIDTGVTIGPGVYVGPGCVIGARCQIGIDSRLEANVTLYHDVRMGERCWIQSGAVLGCDGFGFAPTADGQWCKIHQLGGLQIGNDVEIGANAAVDRGALDDTCIGNGVIIDNMVQIAHNVVIGDHTAIAGSSAIAGSTTIGRHCTLAGGVGVVGHIQIADHVHVTARTLVTGSIAEAGSYSSGTRMEETARWKRNSVRASQLDELHRRQRELERRLEQLLSDKES